MKRNTKVNIKRNISYFQKPDSKRAYFKNQCKHQKDKLNDVAITDGNLADLQVQDVWPHRDDAGGARAKNSPYEKVQLHQCLLEQTFKRVSKFMKRM